MQTGLKRLNGRYSIRRRIPLDLVPHYGGKAEITRALGTADYAEARRLCAREWTKLDQEFEKARAAVGATALASQIPHAKVGAEPPAPRSAAQQRHWEAARDEYEQDFREWDEQELLEMEFDPLRKQVADALWADRAARDGQLAEARKAKRLDERGQGPLLPELVRRWAEEKKPHQKTVAKAELMAKEFYGVVGSLPVDAITKKDVLRFKDHMLRPTAGAHGQGLSAGTINNKLNQLRTLCRYALANDLALTDPVQGVRVNDPKSAGEKVIHYGEDELRAVFTSPVYTQDFRPVGGKGEASYWLPLLALYTGARLNELGQLRPCDVVEESYIADDDSERTAWVLRIVIDEADGLRLKNRSSQRRIPVHHVLEQLGFLKYVDAARRRNHARIFPELKPDKYGRLTAKWGDWYGAYLRKACGVTDRRIVFHSFRHSFKHYARHARLLGDVQNEITGHETGRSADAYGGLEYPLGSLVEEMQKYRVPRFTPPLPPPAYR